MKKSISIRISSPQSCFRYRNTAKGLAISCQYARALCLLIAATPWDWQDKQSGQWRPEQKPLKRARRAKVDCIVYKSVTCFQWGEHHLPEDLSETENNICMYRSEWRPSLGMDITSGCVHSQRTGQALTDVLFYSVAWQWTQLEHETVTHWCPPLSCSLVGIRTKTGLSLYDVLLHIVAWQRNTKGEDSH